jgi:hypothetical protein
MQKIISFDADILEGLAANSDMMSAYVRAAIADHGTGVKVCWSLWPHLTPPAKVGGVARALVKMGLLVPVPGGLYQVVTTKGAITEQSRGDYGAAEQRQTNEATAKKTESSQVGDFDDSEVRAEQEQRESDDEATSQHEASDGAAGGDIEALETLLDSMTTKEIVVEEGPAPTMGLGIRPPRQAAPQLASALEERARALAQRSWEVMPNNVKARVNHNFETYWQESKSQHLRAATNA